MFQIVIDNFVLLHEADINILEFDNSIKQNLILSSTQFFQFLILKKQGHLPSKWFQIWYFLIFSSKMAEEEWDNPFQPEGEVRNYKMLGNDQLEIDISSISSF